MSIRNRPRVSILIPVFRDTGGLQATLESLRSGGIICRDNQVIVCNDGGGEAVSDLACAFGCGEARLESNLGSYAARNAGIRASQSEVLAFLDADQRVGPEWLPSGLQALRHADYVGGRIEIALPDNPTCWHRWNAANGFPVEFYLREHHFAPTANLFVRREVFERVGYFDGNLLSGGDLEFGRRVKAAGLAQSYSPNMVSFHPARGRRALLEKNKRTARGYVQVEVLGFQKNRFLIGLRALRIMASAPVEMLWRLIGCQVLSEKAMRVECMRLIAIGKLMKAHFNYSVILSILSLRRGLTRPKF